MDERSACALLKQKFEAAGFRIQENRLFDEGGVRFEMDGFDPVRRVGYEYLSEEAGDSWDVDGSVIENLTKRRAAGEVFVLIVDEVDTPDARTLAAKADAFLGGLPPVSAPMVDGDESAEPQPYDEEDEDDDDDTPATKPATPARAKTEAASPRAKTASKAPAPRAKSATKKPATKPVAKKKPAKKK